MKIYLICPVRGCTPAVKQQMDAYVALLEAQGHIVHYPPRDVDQKPENSALSVCAAHRLAMLQCDEVHVWWDSNSVGSHFDLGMAYMLSSFRSVKLVIANDYPQTPQRSYGNMLLAIGMKGIIDAK